MMSSPKSGNKSPCLSSPYRTRSVILTPEEKAFAIQRGTALRDRFRGGKIPHTNQPSHTNDEISLGENIRWIACLIAFLKLRETPWDEIQRVLDKPPGRGRYRRPPCSPYRVYCQRPE